MSFPCEARTPDCPAALVETRTFPWAALRDQGQHFWLLPEGSCCWKSHQLPCSVFMGSSGAWRMESLDRINKDWGRKLWRCAFPLPNIHLLTKMQSFLPGTQYWLNDVVVFSFQQPNQPVESAPSQTRGRFPALLPNTRLDNIKAKQGLSQKEENKGIRLIKQHFRFYLFCLINSWCIVVIFQILSLYSEPYGMVHATEFPFITETQKPYFTHLSDKPYFWQCHISLWQAMLYTGQEACNFIFPGRRTPSERNSAQRDGKGMTLPR